MAIKIPIQLPYGAVYFRKSNPPREDWERDYARQAGMDTIFSAIGSCGERLKHPRVFMIGKIMTGRWN